MTLDDEYHLGLLNNLKKTFEHIYKT